MKQAIVLHHGICHRLSQNISASALSILTKSTSLPLNFIEVRIYLIPGVSLA